MSSTLPVVSRFAPSPTGRLHLGHALSAVRAHDLARARGGKFVLRIEDIDTQRCRAEHVAAIIDDLRWLGLAWDGTVVVQSTRGTEHAAALDRLHALGLLYPCICTRADIAASAPHGATPAYPGTCRGRVLDPDDARSFAWRLDVAKAKAVVPAQSGTSHASGPGLRRGDEDDVVLARKGLGVAYHLAVVVDDAAAGVTDVVRGVDLLTAMPVQMLLQRLLGLTTPRYHHHPLVLGPDGQRLAKRTPGATLADLRAAGADPVALVANLRDGKLPVGFSLADA